MGEKPINENEFPISLLETKGRRENMSRRLTFLDLESIGKERNHEIRDMSDYETVDSKITVFCKTCSHEWECTVRSYKNSKKSGCPNCKRRITSETHKNKEVSSETRRKIGTKASQRPGSLTGVFGKDHPCWKGGYGRDFKNPSTADYIWKWGVKERFRGRCALSGISEKLVCHHLNGWNTNEEERWEWKNGVLLSREIHNDFHLKYGFGNNIEMQFAEYVKRYYNRDWENIKSQADTWQPSAKLLKRLKDLRKSDSNRVEEDGGLGGRREGFTIDRGCAVVVVNGAGTGVNKLPDLTLESDLE